MMNCKGGTITASYIVSQKRYYPLSIPSECGRSSLSSGSDTIHINKMRVHVSTVNLRGSITPSWKVVVLVDVCV